MTEILYTSLSFTEGSLGHTARNQGHCWSGKWEENTAGAEESRARGLGLNKAVIVQRKEAIIFSTLQTDRALLFAQTLSVLVRLISSSLEIKCHCSVETCLLKLFYL